MSRWFAVLLTSPQQVGNLPPSTGELRGNVSDGFWALEHWEYQTSKKLLTNQQQRLKCVLNIKFACICKDLSALTMRSDWFFLVLVTFWQRIHCSLHSDSTDRQRPTRNACCSRETARCRCKIRYVSKYTAASRGDTCDSAASCFTKYECKWANQAYEKFRMQYGQTSKIMESIFFLLWWTALHQISIPQFNNLSLTFYCLSGGLDPPLSLAETRSVWIY